MSLTTSRPRTDQRLIDIADVSQIRRKHDLRARDIVGDGHEPMQVDVAVSARAEQVIAVFDDERVVLARKKST